MSENLQKIQLGREATAGTAVAATTLWRGPSAGIDDQRDIRQVEEDIGVIMETDRKFTAGLYASIQFPETPATFEQIQHVLEAGMNTATPTADGAGSGYVSSYLFPTTSTPTIKSYTIEAGDDVQAREMEYSFVESFNLKGGSKDAWMLGSQWGGRQSSLCSFTADVAVPTVEEMVFGKSKLYIDAIGGTIGTTQISSTLINADLSVTTGLVAGPNGDGNLYFNALKLAKPSVSLQVTFIHNASSVAQIAAKDAETSKMLQLKVEGSALTTSGDYTVKTMKIDLYGYWSKFDAIGKDGAGNSIVVGTFEGRYNPTAATAGGITIVNELSAVP